MPYEWQDGAAGERRLMIWRHRSLTPRGFAWVIGTAAGALVLPLVAVIGRSVMWGLLPFAAGALGALWWAMQYGWRNGGPLEEVALTAERMEVVRHDPGRTPRRWHGNPYWVRLALRSDGPVEDYLTVTDGGRVIELGAFLSPEERRALKDELGSALAAARTPPR